MSKKNKLETKQSWRNSLHTRKNSRRIYVGQLAVEHRSKESKRKKIPMIPVI